MAESDEMTFKKLHYEIAYNCLCFDAADLGENTTDCFARLVGHDPAEDGDFLSFYEEGKPLSGSGHKNTCNHRGVSMNKVDETNEAIIREVWAEQVKIKRQMPPLWCKFKLRSNAGKVWYKPTTTPITGNSHHNLMKCDQFGMDKVEIIEIVSLR